MIMVDMEAAHCLLMDVVRLCPHVFSRYCYQQGRATSVHGDPAVIRRELVEWQPRLVSTLLTEDSKTWTQAEVTHETRSA